MAPAPCSPGDVQPLLIDGRVFHPKFVRENLKDKSTWDASSQQRLVFNVSPDIQGSVEGDPAECSDSSCETATTATSNGPRVVQCRFEDGAWGPFEVPQGPSTPAAVDIASQSPKLWPEQGKLVDRLRVNALDFRELTAAAKTAPATWRPEQRLAMTRWIEDFHRDGIAIVKNMPAKPGNLVKFAQKVFGYALPTAYGQAFTIKSRPQPNNLAFSALGLQLHTDLPFCQTAPPIQLFHCIQQASVGGGNIFADGFRVAEKLRARCPEMFETLARVPVRFQDTTSTWKLHAEQRTIEVDEDGRLLRINFNERARDSWHKWSESDSLEEADAFYRALAEFEAMLQDPEEALHFTLQDGEMSVIDNWRLLHSREGFEGDRWLEGGYITREQVHSLWRVLATKDA